MNTIQYRVLEYAQSETQRAACPFLVVLRAQQGQFESFGSLILDDWKTLVPDDQQDDIEYIEDVLYDFRQQPYMAAVESRSVFKGIASLSSGPIRTGWAGECELNDLGKLGGSLFGENQNGVLSCTPERFANILTLLRQNARDMVQT